MPEIERINPEFKKIVTIDVGRRPDPEHGGKQRFLTDKRALVVLDGMEQQLSLGAVDGLLSQYQDRVNYGNPEQRETTIEVLQEARQKLIRRGGRNVFKNLEL